MAEFASAIVGLVAAAEVVTRYVGRYVRHVKHAEHEVLELLVRANALYGALKSLQLLIDDFASRGLDSAISTKEIVACMDTLEKVRTKVNQFDQTGSNPKAVRESSLIRHSKWTWPFARSHTLDLAREVEAHSKVVNLALSVDSVTTALEHFKETEGMRQDVRNVASMISRIEANDKTRRAFVALEPVNTHGIHKTNVLLRYPGTGDWFTSGKEFRQWLSDTRSRLWLHGIPGAGKSVLTAAAVAHAVQSSLQPSSNLAVAYFYCDHRQDSTLSARNIFGSMLVQLARQSQRSCDIVLDFVEKYTASAPQAGGDGPLPCSCEELVEVIDRASEPFDHVMMFVDGVDECPSMERRATIIHPGCLQSTKIKFLMSSRDIPDIRELVEEYASASVAAESTDVRLFVAGEMEKRMQKKSLKRLYISDPALKGEILDTLIAKAGGMFRWVAVQLDYLSTRVSDADIRAALRHTPLTLSASYDRVLLETTHDPDAAALTARALKWIVGFGAVDVAALEEALSVTTNTADLVVASRVSRDHIMRLCGSLIRLGAGETFESAHFSVKEYLASLQKSGRAELQMFALGPETPVEYAQASMRFFNNAAFERPCQTYAELRCRRDAHPFLGLAARQWPIWPSLTHANDIATLKTLFDPARVGHLYSWTQSMWSMPAATDQNCWPWHDTLMSSLHYAAMLRMPDVCKWLLVSCQSQILVDEMIGIPLHCALLGAFANTYLLRDTLKLCPTIPPDEGVAARLCSTVELLSDIALRSDQPFPGTDSASGISTLRLAVMCDMAYHTNLVTPRLLSVGFRCEEDCLDELEAGMCDQSCQERASSLVGLITSEHLSASPGRLFALQRRGLKQLEDKSTVPRGTGGGKTAIPPALKSMLDSDDAITLATQIASGYARVDVTFGPEGTSLLHYCAMYGSVECARLLIAKDAKLDARTSKGATPLFAALERGYTHVAKLLTGAGAGQILRDDEGTVVWHYAVRGADTSSLRFLGEHQLALDLLDHPARDRTTPVLGAAHSASDQLAKVEYLLNLGANERAPVYDCLLSDPDFYTFKALYDADKAVFFTAIANENPVFGDALIELADVVTATQLKVIIGYILTTASRDQSVLFITSLGRWLKDYLQTTGIIDLANLPELCLTIVDSPFSDSTCSFQGVLGWVLDAKNWRSAADIWRRTLKTMINHCRSIPVLESFRHQGRQLITTLLDAKEYDLAATLLDRGISVSNRDDKTAGAKSAQETVIVLDCPSEISKKILSAPSDPTPHPTTGDSLLHYWARSGSPEQLDWLLALNGDIEMRNVRDEMPLMATCYSNSLHDLSTYRYSQLVSKGASEEAEEVFNWTVAHHAVIGRNLEILKGNALATDMYGWRSRVGIRTFSDAGDGPRPLEIFGASLAHVAAFLGNDAALDYLLSHVDVYQVNELTQSANPVSVLHCAVLGDHEPTTAVALKHGASITAAPGDETLLHVAARYNRAGVVGILTKHGVDPNRRCVDGLKAIDVARDHGYSDFVTELDKHMLDYTSAIDSSLVTNNDRIARRRQQRELGDAIHCGELARCRELLDSGASASCHWAKCNSCDPVIQAARRDSRENTEAIILLLLSRGGRLTRRRSCETHGEASLIQECAKAGYTKALEWILEHCPGLSFLRYTCPPLHLAALNDRYDCIELMLGKAEVAWAQFTRSGLKISPGPESNREYDSEEDSNTLLGQHKACLDIVHWTKLVHMEADFGEARSSADIITMSQPAAYFSGGMFDLPLQCAVWGSRTEAVKLLISCGAAIDRRTSSGGYTMLDTILEHDINEDNSILNLFDDHHLLRRSGYRRCDWAIANHSTAAAKKLSERVMGASAWHDSTAKNLHGTSIAIDMACKYPELLVSSSHCRTAVQDRNMYGSWVYSDLIRKRRPHAMTILLNSGLDLSWIDPMDGSILHDVRWYDDRTQQLNLIFRRLGKTATQDILNAKPAREHSLPYHAAAMSQRQVMKLFMRHGADLEVEGGPYGTPLMAAALYGRLEMVKLLVRAGAKVAYYSPQANEYRSALLNARTQRHDDVVRWLLVERFTEVRSITVDDFELKELRIKFIKALWSSDRNSFPLRFRLRYQEFEVRVGAYAKKRPDRVGKVGTFAKSYGYHHDVVQDSSGL
ncbi:Vegetative incompatibility protein HET-E-1 [Cyphellophora attinorum]|uniref:Vegetative incompatibility protein HET-E-1 n=1 Tax=Cyphellophora attinorum TaxID=1664694 RepID=A0A0N1GZ79_9EURO|nr:Vegetative incompatibility protein HET-E-1 [Phialophora attinorum]KPI36255.1 Vegetative incompatibility protein HET-E-1 [Phialophora attinorum]